MNQSLVNSSNSNLQLISALIVLIPVAIIFIKQKGSNRYFLALAAANLMFFVSSALLNNFISLPEKTATIISTLSNVLQAPLTLIFLLQFTESKKITRAIRNILALILGVSTIVIGFNSYDKQTTLNLMTLGIVPVFIFSSILFIQYVKTSVYYQKGTNKAFMLSAIVFANGSYMMLLLLNMVSPAKHASDLHALFGVITIISTTFVSLSIAMFDVNKKEEIVSVETKQQTPVSAFAQWDDFSLVSTPEVAKNSVTNISKYYPSYQKS